MKEKIFILVCVLLLFLFGWFLKTGYLASDYLGAGLFDLVRIGDDVNTNPEDALEDEKGTGDNFYNSIYEDVVKSSRGTFLDDLQERVGASFDEEDLKGVEGVADVFKVGLAALDGVAAVVTQGHVRLVEEEIPEYRVDVSSLGGETCAGILARKDMQRMHGVDLLRDRLLLRMKERTSLFAGLSKENVLQRLDLELEVELQSQAEYAERARDSDALVECENFIQEESSFQSELVRIFPPIEKKVTILQAFMNGRLDDFEDPSAFNKLKDWGLPKFDLVLDLDIVEKIIFGSSVFLSDSASGSGVLPVGSVSLAGADVPTVDELSIDTLDAVLDADGNIALQPSDVGGLSFPSSPSSESGSSSSSTVSEQGDGSSLPVPVAELDVSQLEGEHAVCEYEEDEGLDFSGLNDDGVFEPEGEGDDVPVPIPERDGFGTPVLEVPSEILDALVSGGVTGLPIPQLGEEIQSAVTAADSISNRDERGGFECALKEGDYLSYMFCLSVQFLKVGKSWEKERENNTCLICFLRDINKMFEEEIFLYNVRPHKNTGMVMESGMCSDANDDKVEFSIDVQKVPVKFYDDICYPKGGFYEQAMAEMYGFPNFVSVFSKPNSQVTCNDPDITGKAYQICVAAIGSGTYSSEDFQRDYLQRTSRWKTLVGKQGMVERRIHEFMVRMGEKKPQLAEDKNPVQIYTRNGELIVLPGLTKKDSGTSERKSFDYDFIKRKEKIKQLLKKHKNNPTAKACIMGYIKKDNPACKKFSIKDSQTSLDGDVKAERKAVMKELQDWNKAKASFEKEQTCSPFEGAGPLDAFEAFFKDGFSKGAGSYYYSSDKEPLPNKENEFTGQILNNIRKTTLEGFYNSFEKLTAESEHLEKKNVGNDVAALLRDSLESQFSALETEMRMMEQYVGAINDQLHRLHELLFKSIFRYRSNVLEEIYDKTQYN